MVTNSRSWRPASQAARSTRRPMRPNPLMETFTAIASIPSRYSAEPFARRGDHRLGRDSKVLEEFVGRRAGAEAGHADEGAVGAKPAFPAHADRGLDADARR